MRVTDILGGSKFLTLDITIPAIKELEYCLSTYETENILIVQVKNIILENLRKRWEIPLNLGLYGFFLDSRFKKLSFITNNVSKLKII